MIYIEIIRVYIVMTCVELYNTNKIFEAHTLMQEITESGLDIFDTPDDIMSKIKFDYTKLTKLIKLRDDKIKTFNTQHKQNSQYIHTAYANVTDKNSPYIIFSCMLWECSVNDVIFLLSHTQFYPLWMHFIKEVKVIERTQYTGTTRILFDNAFSSYLIPRVSYFKWTIYDNTKEDKSDCLILIEDIEYDFLNDKQIDHSKRKLMQIGTNLFTLTQSNLCTKISFISKHDVQENTYYSNLIKDFMLRDLATQCLQSLLKLASSLHFLTGEIYANINKEVSVFFKDKPI
jgi:hypothetical protein